MSVLICIPAYGGQVQGAFASSLVTLALELTKARVSFGIEWLYNESDVTRARNRLASKFFSEERWQILQFLDADLEFNSAEVRDQIDTCLSVADLGLVAGSYPSKSYSPAAIARAAASGVPPREVMAHGLRLVTNLPGKGTSDGFLEQDTPIETLWINGKPYVKSSYLPTGLMTIRRSTFEAILIGPDKDILPYVTQDGTPQWDFFAHRKALIDGKMIRLSEDYAFCARAAEVGITPWWNADNVAIHWGTHRFVPAGLT